MQDKTLALLKAAPDPEAVRQRLVEITEEKRLLKRQLDFTLQVQRALQKSAEKVGA